MMYSKNCSLTFRNKNKASAVGQMFFFLPFALYLSTCGLPVNSSAAHSLLIRTYLALHFLSFSPLLSEKVTPLLCPGAVHPSSAAWHFSAEHAYLGSCTQWVSSLPLFVSLTSCHSHISQRSPWGRRTMANTAGAVRIDNSFNYKLINDAAAWGQEEKKEEH